MYNLDATNATNLLGIAKNALPSDGLKKPKKGKKGGGEKLQRGGIIVAAAHEIIGVFKMWFTDYRVLPNPEKVFKLPTTNAEKEFNLLKIIRQTLIISGTISKTISGSNSDKIIKDWKNIFYMLTPSNKYIIGFFIVYIFNGISKQSVKQEDVVEYECIGGALRSQFLDTTYGDFFTTNISAELPEINSETATDPKTFQNATVLSNNEDSGIGILDRDNNIQPPPASSLPSSPTVTETKSTITVSQLLLLQTILSNEIYEVAIKNAMESFKEEAYDEIEEASGIDDNGDVVMTETNVVVDNTAFAPEKNIRDKKIEVKNRISSYQAIISAIDIWKAQNCSSIKEFEDVGIYSKCQILDTFKEKINNYLEKTYNEWCEINDISKKGGRKMYGGQTSLKDLQGKLVIYKYDKELKKYIIADYNEVFKKYFPQNKNPTVGPPVASSSAPPVATHVAPSSAPTISPTKGGKNNIKRNGISSMLPYRFKTHRKKHIKLTRKKQRQIKRRKTKKRQMKRKRITRRR